VPTPALDGSRATVEAELPAARVQELRRQLPALTGGEGVLESDFAAYRPVAGQRPVRPGTKMV
jgi:ribosomal protection tetracycline resistance protein